RKPRTKAQEMMSAYDAREREAAGAAEAGRRFKEESERAKHEEIEPTDPEGDFADLSGHYQVLIGRHVTGDSLAKMAREFHHSKETIEAILDANPVAIRQAAAVAGRLAPAEVFSEMLPLATGRMKRVLEEGKDRDALPIAINIADRVFGKPIIRTVVDVRGDINITWIRKSDEAIEGEVVGDD
ncbi:hypothetical protein LCGC14_2196030, partial [marine sediment metagenome]